MTGDQQSFLIRKLFNVLVYVRLALLSSPLQLSVDPAAIRDPLLVASGMS